MADFLSALRAGLDAADVAESNRKEIDKIFNDLNDQISVGTMDKVEISRAELYKPTNDLIASVAMMLQKRETYWALAVHSKATKQYSEVAKWSQDRAGYPCKITLGSSELRCDDGEGLERALAVVLRDPIVGEVIQKFMRLEAKTEE